MSDDEKAFVEELEVTGRALVEQVRTLVRQGHARRVTLYTRGHEELLGLPLTLGVVAGGLVTLSAPVLGGLGAVAALVSQVRLVVTPDRPPDRLEGPHRRDGVAPKFPASPPDVPL